MRIALIFAPYDHKIYSENLSTVDEEFCVAPPLILAYVAAILEKHGHKVILIDARATNLTKEQALKKIAEFKPDALAFRAETYHFHDFLEYVGYLKKNLNDIPVITGGINMTFYPEETMSHPEVDYGIVGEAIDSLPALVSALEEGRDFSGIPGVAFKKDGSVKVNPPENKPIDFDSYPFPARHLLSNELYHSFISQLKNFTIMVTSTGCPFRCSFCAIHPVMPYRLRSPKNVVDEIEECCKKFGIREIDFFDATFLIPKRRTFEIFDEMKARGIKIEWSCRSRVDVVDEEVLRRAAEAGCRQIYFGIESVNHKVLEAIKKDVKLEQIKDAIRWSRKYGIRAMGFFMVGNPEDTPDSIRQTIKFAKDLGLDFIQVCRTIAKPGTELDKQLIEKTGKDYWREHIRGKRMTSRLPAPWTGLSPVEVESLTKEFYTKFYFRPSVIFKRIKQLKSPEEFFRYVKVALKILTQRSELYRHIVTDMSEAEMALIESRSYMQEAGNFKTAIVIPTYNEKDNIQNIVAGILKVVPGAKIVIVDDNSPDGTGVMADEMSAENPNIHVIHHGAKRGLGPAYIDGFKYVLEKLDSEYIFEMDADLSHDPMYIPIFLHYARDYGLVTGSRFLNAVTIKNRKVWRNALSVSSKWVVNLLIGLKLTDVTTGFKCFRASVLEEIELDKIRSKGYAFQIETSCEAARRGILIKEIPIIFSERVAGKSKMSRHIITEGFMLVLRLTADRISGRRKPK